MMKTRKQVELEIVLMEYKFCVQDKCCLGMKVYKLKVKPIMLDLQGIAGVSGRDY